MTRKGQVISIDGVLHVCIEYHEDVKRGVWQTVEPMNPKSAFPLYPNQVLADTQISDCPIIQEVRNA